MKPLVMMALLLCAGARPAAATRVAHAAIAGPRPVALGGAGSALQPGGGMLLWNPAALAGLDRQELSGSTAGLFGTGARENVGAFALPLGEGQAIGFEWNHTGYEDPGLDFGEDSFALGYGRRLARGLCAGATVRYLRRTVSADAVLVGSGHGVGADLGLLLTPAPTLRAALVLHDVTDTRLDSGDEGTVYARGLRVGVTWAAWSGGLLAAELDDQFHAGVEWTPLAALALRAGVRQPLNNDQGAIWSLGAGAQVGFLRLDVARELHPVLDATQHIGVGTSFHFNPALVRIEGLDSGDIYVSLYRQYAGQAVGSARLRNLSNSSVETVVGLTIPGVAEEPPDQRLTLAPGELRDVPLTFLLSDAVLRVTGDRMAQARLTVSYAAERLKRTERRQVRMRVFGRGVLDWGARGGVAQAAAFITPDDPCLVGLGGQAARVAGRPEVCAAFVTPEVARCAALFDLLSARGISYQPDPLSPYGDHGAGERALDTVRYPRETLHHGSGDCDDTTVLMASLLGHLGVATCFVDVPGHIFLLADAGLRADLRPGLGLDDGLTVTHAGRTWLPLETTVLPAGFAEAWRRGADAWREYARLAPPRVVATGPARARYEPGALDALPAQEIPATPADSSLVARIERDAAQVTAWRTAWMARRYPVVDSTATPLALRTLANLCHGAGDDSSAGVRLAAWLVEAPNSPPALNNRAVLAAATGRVAEARADLEMARRLDPTEPLYAWNLALLAAARPDPAGMVEALRGALATAGGPAALAACVGLPSTAATESSLTQALSARINPATAPGPGAADRPALLWKE